MFGMEQAIYNYKIKGDIMKSQTEQLLDNLLNKLDKGIKAQMNNDNKYIVVAGFLSHEFTALLINLNQNEGKKDSEINSLKEKIKQLEKSKIENDVKKAVAEKI